MKLTRLSSFKQDHLQPLWPFDQNVNWCKPGGEPIPVRRLAWNFWKAYPDLQKEKEIHKWAGIVVKREKRSGAAWKHY